MVCWFAGRVPEKRAAGFAPRERGGRRGLNAAESEVSANKDILYFLKISPFDCD